jgi:hypothetical protein
VVCDSVTALELPAKVRAIRFTVLDEPTLAELRRHEQTLSPPHNRWDTPDSVLIGPTPCVQSP